MEKLFDNKRIYKDINGNEMLNMCIPSIDINKISANAILILNQSYNGRLDKFVYDNVSRDIDEGLDKIMYFNHIFNPFAVKDGDILYTPVEGGNIYTYNSEPTLPDNTHLSDRNIDQKQMTYAERVEYYAKLGLGVS